MNDSAKVLYAILAFAFACIAVGWAWTSVQGWRRRRWDGRLTREERARFKAIRARWDETSLTEILNDEGDTR